MNKLIASCLSAEHRERMSYDHQKDPNENIDILENPENKVIIDTMQSQLNAHRNQL